ncbi:LOW QUALITY PROTEIN: uncharacterized protein LOC142364198 [Opisthocomus hoazin]|uniref:LOW QUALITY PROTEIN: uncharacterized protein LOC142364198 n=1 Tax=Opisthocomus hoazin TaxID=30419 RepID=UPI003F532203
MRRCRGAGLAGLAAVLLAAAVRGAQVQQEPLAETTEGTGISINCSHPNIQSYDYIFWYRQLPGRGPTFLVSTLKGSKDVPAPPGRLSVAADRRSSALWLARPRRGDAAVYYCAVETRGEEPGLRPGTNRRGRGRACVSGAGGSPGRARQGALPLCPPIPPRPARPRRAPPLGTDTGTDPSRPCSPFPHSLDPALFLSLLLLETSHVLHQPQIFCPATPNEPDLPTGRNSPEFIR